MNNLELLSIIIIIFHHGISINGKQITTNFKLQRKKSFVEYNRNIKLDLLYKKRFYQPIPILLRTVIYFIFIFFVHFYIT